MEDRERLIPLLGSFSGLLMLTLTVDPKLFGSPREAWQYVREKRAIAVLVRKLFRAGCLHSERFYWVIEWHKNGWPHWHLLVDASFIPFDQLCRFWNSFRPKQAPVVEGCFPGFGMAWISKAKFANPVHAARYATKYVIKHPTDGFPAWVESESYVRRSGHSQGLFPPEPSLRWTENAEPSASVEAPPEPRKVVYGVIHEVREINGRLVICWPEDAADVESSPNDAERTASTIRDRVRSCGTRAVVLCVEEIELPGGELVQRRTFCGVLPWAWGPLAEKLTGTADLRGFVVTAEEANRLLAGKLPPPRHSADNDSSRGCENSMNPCVDSSFSFLKEEPRDG